MKKIILLAVIVVLIVSVSVFAFMGCQGQVSLTQFFSEENVWREKTTPEIFTYSMYKNGETTSMGTLTMQVDRLERNTTYYMGQDGIATSDNAIYSVTTPTANPV